MYIWTGLTARVIEPSPLLTHLAPTYAARIAARWPAPHAPFLTAPAARRHLVCLALALDETGDPPLELAVDGGLKPALRRLLPTAPEGLPRALERLGEIAWAAEDYCRLLELLADPVRGKIIRHAQALEPVALKTLALAPEPLLRGGVTRLKLSPHQAGLLAEALAAVERRAGVNAGKAAANRWGRASDVKSLFEWVEEDILSELPPPPFEGTRRLLPLRTKAAMREAGGRFNNCLKTRISSASGGTAAFYEWLGPPGAIVEIVRDPVYGWRLDETKLKGNAVMAEPDRLALIETLHAIGVHIGRNSWNLSWAIGAAAEGREEGGTVAEAVARAFED